LSLFDLLSLGESTPYVVSVCSIFLLLNEALSFEVFGVLFLLLGHDIVDVAEVNNHALGACVGCGYLLDKVVIFRRRFNLLVLFGYDVDWLSCSLGRFLALPDWSWYFLLVHFLIDISSLLRRTLSL
jgi:hypothetical protein